MRGASRRADRGVSGTGPCFRIKVGSNAALNSIS
jgi:hypothetical protein